MLCCAHRRSFKYKPLQDDEESAHLTGPTDTSAHTAAAEHSSDSSSPACRAGGGGGGGLTADLEVAEAAAAAEAASAAVRASRAAHKEALTAAAQVGLGMHLSVTSAALFEWWMSALYTEVCCRC